MTNPTWSDRVIAWATERNIIGGTTAKDQFFKLIEEVGELADGMQHGDRKLIEDSIGDSCVVLTIMAHQTATKLASTERWSGNGTPMIELINRCGSLSSAIQKDNRTTIDYELNRILGTLHRIAHDAGMWIDECKEAAWNEIKDRKGRIEGGVFVKE
jgi:hypothetical protein